MGTSANSPCSHMAAKFLVVEHGKGVRRVNILVVVWVHGLEVRLADFFVD